MFGRIFCVYDLFGGMRRLFGVEMFAFRLSHSTIRHSISAVRRQGSDLIVLG